MSLSDLDQNAFFVDASSDYMPRTIVTRVSCAEEGPSDRRSTSAACQAQ